MSAPKEIDCDFTKEIVCPHCGYEHQDSWEWGPDTGEYDSEGECGECGKAFIWSRYIETTYNTRKP